MKQFSSHSQFDNTYLIRLLNGNIEMANTIVEDIIKEIPWCLTQVEYHLSSDHKEEAMLYVLKAKSAFTVLQDKQLTLDFNEVENLAKEGEWSLVQNRFSTLKEKSIHYLNELNAAA